MASTKIFAETISKPESIQSIQDTVNAFLTATILPGDGVDVKYVIKEDVTRSRNVIYAFIAYGPEVKSAYVGGSGADGMVYSCGENSLVVTDRYLRGPDGIPTNESPIVIPFDAQITGIIAYGAASGGWTAQIHDALTPIPDAELNVPDGESDAYIIDLEIDIAEGALLQVYASGTGISKPRVEILIKRKP